METLLFASAAKPKGTNVSFRHGTNTPVGIQKIPGRQVLAANPTPAPVTDASLESRLIDRLTGPDVTSVSAFFDPNVVPSGGSQPGFIAVLSGKPGDEKLLICGAADKATYDRIMSAAQNKLGKNQFSDLAEKVFSQSVSLGYPTTEWRAPDGSTQYGNRDTDALGKSLDANTAIVNTAKISLTEIAGVSPVVQTLQPQTGAMAVTAPTAKPGLGVGA